MSLAVLGMVMYGVFLARGGVRNKAVALLSGKEVAAGSPVKGDAEMQPLLMTDSPTGKKK